MCLGLGNGCVPKKENKTSLLKQKTNFDKLKDLSAWEFAGKWTILLKVIATSVLLVNCNLMSRDAIRVAFCLMANH